MWVRAEGPTGLGPCWTRLENLGNRERACTMRIRKRPCDRSGPHLRHSSPSPLVPRPYLAISVTRVSRSTVTLISPGYVNCCSNAWAMSWQILAAEASVVSLGVGDHAQLAAGLDGIRLLDAGETAGDRLQLFHPFDVAFERFAAGAGPRSAAGVGRGHQHRVGMVDADVVVVAQARHGPLPALRRSA